MVDDDHSVSLRFQIAHHAEQTVHIRRVQADGRFVEHVEHAGGAVAHGAGQLHPLALTGGKR